MSELVFLQELMFQLIWHYLSLSLTAGQMSGYPEAVYSQISTPWKFSSAACIWKFLSQKHSFNHISARWDLHPSHWKDAFIYSWDNAVDTGHPYPPLGPSHQRYFSWLQFSFRILRTCQMIIFPLAPHFPSRLSGSSPLRVASDIPIGHS